MRKYKILKSSSLINEEQLTDLAKQGWRLIQIIGTAAEGYHFYFESVPDYRNN